MVSEKEIQEILDELNTVRPEMLNENAKRLFEAVMQIADKRDELQQRIDKAVEYCNNNIEFSERLIDVIDILKGNDK